VKINTTAVVIGAGPYGLSVAAHLKAQNIPTLTFGKPMEFWKKMPSAMYLKSTWSSVSLSAPNGKYTLDQYAASINSHKQKPIPLSFFLDYCRWFQEQTDITVDPTYVQSLARDGEGFRVELADGRTVEASHVVVAAGVAPFANIPQFALDLPPTLASHTQEHTDLTPFKGRNVAVIGRGQSALEYAALLHEAGAEVEVIARGPFVWIDRKLYDRTGPARHIFYPPSDIGPAGVSWIVAFPTLFSHLPEKQRDAIDRRSIRPSGAQWLRPRVEGKIRLTPNTEVIKAIPQGEGLHCTLSDGTTRNIDYLFLGTGYQASLEKFSFIDPSLRDQIQQQDSYPLQNTSFESSVPHLYFAGTITAFTFGPICRFVTGSNATAHQISRHIVRTASSVRMPVPV
jgi:cation diffusion facilitator CzcD-associated flavoprotein CzcO